jgi:hypothetical protein
MINSDFSLADFSKLYGTASKIRQLYEDNRVPVLYTKK